MNFCSRELNARALDSEGTEDRSGGGANRIEAMPRACWSAAEDCEGGLEDAGGWPGAVEGVVALVEDWDDKEYG